MYLLSMIIINIFVYDYHTCDLHKMNENFFFWKRLLENIAFLGLFENDTIK